MNKKTIKMICCGPVGFSLTESSPWEDVWLEYKVRRKIKKEGPCFICGVDRDIEHQKDMIKFVESRKSNKYNNKEHYVEEIERLEKIKEKFADVEFYCDSWKNGVPNIYINRPEMRRKDIEDATEWYLREKGVLKGKPRFNWKKTKIMVVPC